MVLIDKKIIEITNIPQNSTKVTTLEKKVSWAQEVLSRKDSKLQEVKHPNRFSFSFGMSCKGVCNDCVIVR